MAGFYVPASCFYVTFLEILCCNQVATAPFVAPNASSLVSADLGKVGHQVWHQVFGFLGFFVKDNDDFFMDNRIVILIL